MTRTHAARVPASPAALLSVVLSAVLSAALSAAAAATLAAALASCGGGAQGPSGTAAAPATAQPAGAAAGPGQGEALATAEAVMEASIAAQGGRARMGKLRSIRQTGAVLMPQMGIKGTMTAVGAPPRSTLLTIELAGLGKIRQGVSGDVVWELTPITGARVISGAERAQLLREAVFNADLAWKEIYPKAELAGVVEHGGRPAYKVVLTAADGDVQTRYFAKDTLLPVAVQMIARSQMGEVPVETELSDWREVGGIKYAHKLARKEGPQTIEILIDKVELDPALDPQAFALPPEIAALPKPAAPAGAPGK